LLGSEAAPHDHQDVAYGYPIGPAEEEHDHEFYRQFDVGMPNGEARGIPAISAIGRPSQHHPHSSGIPIIVAHI
jgi:hypothetical protein